VLVVVNTLWQLFLRTLALLLCGIQMADVKDSVIVVQVWNQWFL